MGWLDPSDPWFWLGAAAVLGVAEMLAPGYLLLGFAIAAAAAAAVTAQSDPPLLWLLIGWAALALAIWWALAGRGRSRARRHESARDINDFDNNRGRTSMIRLALTALLLAAPACADPVGLTRDLMSVTVPTENGPVEISRIQDNDHKLTDDWAKTSRPCPNFCIQPMQLAEGVTTIGELELLDMLKDPDAVVADSRTEAWFAGGAIPGAISIPYLTAADRLDLLGCEPDFEGWDCDGAKQVALYCNGPWCGQSPTAIPAMIAAGFPTEKIHWYRGGMQLWRLLGLTVTGE